MRRKAYAEDGALRTMLEFSPAEVGFRRTAEFEYEGQPGQEKVARKTEYRTDGTLAAKGDWSDGHWSGGVRFYGDDGGLVAASAYNDKGQVLAVYDVEPNTFTPGLGVSFDRDLNATSMRAFHTIVNELRADAYTPFFEGPSYERYAPLVEALDFAEATGMPVEAIQNFDLDAPENFEFSRAHFDAWLDNAQKSGDLAPEAIQSINKMRKFLSHSNQAVNGFRSMGWFLTDVLGGSGSDYLDIGKKFFNFSKSVGGKFLGRAAGEVSEDVINQTFKGVKAAKGVSAFGRVAKIAGPLATLAFAGYDLYEGITGFREAKERGASKVEKAYYVFLAVGGGLGGGITAAIDAKDKGLNTKQQVKAFFAGLFGVYDPQNPGGLIEGIRTERNRRESLRTSMNAIKDIEMPGFKGEDHFSKNRTRSYDSVHDPHLETKFHDFMENYHSDSAAFYPRIEGINGYYKSANDWEWYDGYMPLYALKDGSPNPPTIDDLIIVGTGSEPAWSAPDAALQPSVPGHPGGGGGFGCWVAREVYGADNPKWLAFREWLLQESPAWFRQLYLGYGRQFARFISNRPWLKSRIRVWMESKIDPGLDLNSRKFRELMAEFKGQSRTVVQ